jgi:hypothetical protein
MADRWCLANATSTCTRLCGRYGGSQILAVQKGSEVPPTSATLSPAQTPASPRRRHLSPATGCGRRASRVRAWCSHCPTPRRLRSSPRWPRSRAPPAALRRCRCQSPPQGCHGRSGTAAWRGRSRARQRPWRCPPLRHCRRCRLRPPPRSRRPAQTQSTRGATPPGRPAAARCRCPSAARAPRRAATPATCAPRPGPRPPAAPGATWWVRREEGQRAWVRCRATTEGFADQTGRVMQSLLMASPSHAGEPPKQPPLTSGA